MPVLRGVVRSVDENVLVSGPSEEIVLSSVQVSATFGVYDAGGLLLGEDTNGDGAPDAEFARRGYAEFDTNRGEDRGTATEEALRDLAEMIVLELQERHDDRFEPNDSAEEAATLESGRQVALIQREADWFEVEVPARKAVVLTLYGPAGGVDLEGGVAGRTSHQRVAYTEGTARFCVLGDDTGLRYTLQVDTLDDDPFEPDDQPADAHEIAPNDTVQRLQKDDDWFGVDVPAGKGLVARVVSQGRVAVRATDPDGAPLPEAESEGDAVRVPAAAEARRVLLRVEGDGTGRVYDLSVNLAE